MIHVIYNRDKHSLSVRGHAGSGDKGHDLVCAAASALVLTAAANVSQLAAQGSVREQKIRLSEGDALVACRAGGKMHSVVTLMLDTICTGFQMLEMHYPENILCRVVQG